MTITTDVRKLQQEFGELLATHEHTRSLDDFSRYASDPVGFIREVLKGDPWSAQIAIAESVRDDPLIVVRSANSIGKDWLAARLALWWVYARKGLVLLTGPTQRQVREIVMGEVGRAFGKARDLPGELYANALRLPGTEQAGILAFTSSDSSKLTGYHAPRVLVCITEAQGVEGFTWEAALACATGADDRILAVGNPLSPVGRFFEASRSPNWASHAISAFEHPNVIEGRAVIPGAITATGVKRIADEYGTGSGVYKARVLGEFPDESLYGLVRRAWLQQAAERHEEGSLTEAANRHAPVVAVDPARYGPDFTAMAVRRGPVLETIVVWSKLDTMETAARVQAEAARFGVYPAGSKWKARGTIVVDVIGIGAGVLDRLRQLGYAVVPFNGGAGAREPDRFLNARAESFWTLRKLLEDGKVAIGWDQLLVDELTEIQWKGTANGKVQIEAKDDLRNRLGRSPDRADSVAMALADVALYTTRVFRFAL